MQHSDWVEIRIKNQHGGGGREETRKERGNKPRQQRVQGSLLEVTPIVTGPVSSRCAETGDFLPDPDLVR